MSQPELLAISPIDGRYSAITQPLTNYCSEYALLRYRLIIEINWLRYLSQLPAIDELAPLSAKENTKLDAIISNFDLNAALQVKQIEQNTKHDMKAIEYYLSKLCAQDAQLKNKINYIHFAITSEDINNAAYGIMLVDCKNKYLIPLLQQISEQLQQYATQYADVTMLARTHGQPASPTTMGKEFANFAYRLYKALTHFNTVEITAKFSGAVGNYNAHYIAYPTLDWPNICATFIQSLDLCYNPYTTQIEPHDNLAHYCHSIIVINNILLNLCRDLWGYIALNYFAQHVDATSIGSSTMPHKINPIHFENAEGNLGLANALLDHFANKLTISRWQRDLSDSTVLRNLGSAFAYCGVAYTNIISGLQQIAIADANIATMQQELNQNWTVLAEAVQTILRKYNIDDAYEKLKHLTRGQIVTKKLLHDFIQQQAIPTPAKEQLLNLTPASYLGIAKDLANNAYPATPPTLG